jgi:UDP-N-acetylmuramate dehydrogenase
MPLKLDKTYKHGWKAKPNMVFEAHLQHFLKDEPLHKYTVARMGGTADYVYVARHNTPLHELIEVIQSAWADAIPVRVLGGGANILVSDKGVRGLVIINHITEMNFAPNNVYVSAGTGILSFARECVNQGYGGMEWAVGVPGTIGGAIVNNAGAHGDDMSKSMLDIQLLEPAGERTVSQEELAYDYRTSSLKQRTDRRFMVLSAHLALAPSDPEQIQNKMTEFNTYRKRTQPGGASLGSVFKNPPNDYAGRLIEASGLKGYQIGTAQVSPIHANFFLNIGNANASDYYALIQHVQHTVKQQHGVDLELEIELVGEW